MATRKKKLPELELPAVINTALVQYFGPRTMNKLLPSQRSNIARAVQHCADHVAAEIDNPPQPGPDHEETARLMGVGERS